MRAERQPPRTYFNPLPSCEGRLSARLEIPDSTKISIHSPHARGDTAGGGQLSPFDISIHSPHARGDKSQVACKQAHQYFNPLPSCEGRLEGCIQWPKRLDFNPLPSCEGRPLAEGLIYSVFSISIHSPHARGDADGRRFTQTARNFNPLPSCEGRRRRVASGHKSTHFNPLPSCEGRPAERAACAHRADFNPLPSCEGRLSVSERFFQCQYFNPLPSCEGRRSHWMDMLRPTRYFNPLPSCEGRRRFQAGMTRQSIFQSTPLMRGETLPQDCHSVCP